MFTMTPELMEKVKQAKSAEELREMAKREGFELTESQAESYYRLACGTGEMSDEELDNVAGGGCNARDGRLVVTVGHCCDGWVCKKCGGNSRYSVDSKDYNGDTHSCGGGVNVPYVNCNSCKYMTYERGLWLCNNPRNSQ